MLLSSTIQCVPTRILFVCTHNSARSILAEALLRHHAGGRFEAFSAGSSPRENQQPNPLGLAALAANGIDIGGLSSKSWDAFVAPNAPTLHAVITVCDSAAGESCPLFSGPISSRHPARAHWGYADPSAGDASDATKRLAFDALLVQIDRRIRALVELPDEQLTAERLAANLTALGQA